MLTQKRLKELLKYDKDLGTFTRLVQLPGSQKQVGTLAGSKTDHMVRIKIDGNTYSAHRLAFLYVDGVLPEEVDHTNHDTYDNRWINLQNGTHAENMKNKKRYKNNTSGVVGVRWQKSIKRWVANISVDKKNVYLGTFTVFHEAVDARKNAEVLYDFHENHGKDYA